MKVRGKATTVQVQEGGMQIPANGHPDEPAAEEVFLANKPK